MAVVDWLSALTLPGSTLTVPATLRDVLGVPTLRDSAAASVGSFLGEVWALYSLGAVFSLMKEQRSLGTRHDMPWYRLPGLPRASTELPAVRGSQGVVERRGREWP